MKLPKTIKETQNGLLAKEFSAVDLVNSYLGNIKAKNKELNAVLTITEDLAYRQAKEIDSKILRYKDIKIFEDYPLLGVTVIHKDMFLTKDIRTTAGSKVLEGYIPAYSATVVKKMEDAGAIILGKANCDAWAHGSSGENSDFGATKNPFNQEYVSGGSSSGSAVSVAAEFCLVATGTDTGGSIRNPASFCGVVGLKPTYGAVSRYGVIAMASSLDCPGPIANTVEDARRVFDVIKGEDGCDGNVSTPQTSYAGGQAKFRIGLPKEYFEGGIGTEVKEAVNDAINKFKKLGVEFVDISLPHTKYGVSAYYIVCPAEVSSNLARYDGVRFGETRESFGDEAKRRIMLGTHVLSAGYYDQYYIKAMKVRRKMKQDFDKVFDGKNGVDAILTPVSPTAAFKLGEKTNDPVKMYLADIFTVVANMVGIPGIAIPNGKTPSQRLRAGGLPLGFQLLGPKFGEDTLFKLGELFQNA